ncbi:MAG: hypothetical protein AAGH89_19480, partial [Verrucomicrobiota bacterium]
MTDVYWKTISGWAEASAAAYRIAKGEGRKGEEMDSRIKELVETQGSLAWQLAVRKADELSFTAPLRVGNQLPAKEKAQMKEAGLRIAESEGLSGEAAKNRSVEIERLLTPEMGGTLETVGSLLSRARTAEIANPAVKILQFLFRMKMPFVSTPTQLAKAGFRVTPLGLVMAAEKAIYAGYYKSRDGIPFMESYPAAMMVRDAADQIIGFSIIGLVEGVFNAVEGDEDDDKKPFLITGTSPWTPSNRGLREHMERTEGMPMQLRIGKEGPDALRVPLRRLDPAVTTLMTVVDTVRAHKRNRDRTGVDQLKHTVLESVVHSVFQGQDKTFFSALNELIRTFQEWQNVAMNEEGASDATLKQMAKEVHNTASAMVVPNFFKQIVRESDDYRRDSRNAPWWYHWMPVGNDAVPIRHDAYGRPIKKQYSDGFGRVRRLVLDAGLEPTSHTPELYDQLVDSILLQNYGDMPQGTRAISRPRDHRYRDIDSKSGWMNMTGAEIADYEQRVGEQFHRELRTLIKPSDLRKP